MKQAVILAGGKGTRLRSVMGDLPKPLAQVGGQALLGHQLALLRNHGFEEVLILVNYGAHYIEDWLKTQDFNPLIVRLIDDGEPRGTAGAVLAVFDELADEFAVLYADTMVEIDLSRFTSFHHAVPDCAASLFLHPNDHPADSDLVETGEDNHVLAFHPYPHAEGAYLPNLVNAALYIVKKRPCAPGKMRENHLILASTSFPPCLTKGFCYVAIIRPNISKTPAHPPGSTRCAKLLRAALLPALRLT